VTRADEAEMDPLLLCYCTDLTIGELRRACAAGRWPLPDKERTGKLCTGCMGDLLHCLRLFGAEPRAGGSR
jgi:hypothetical protein